MRALPWYHKWVSWRRWLLVSPPSRPNRRCCLTVETLEDRLAPATIINVTTFADVVDPGDGVISLREAVIQANNTAGDFEIRLQAGTYYLTIAGVGEDAAATGDLDILNNGTITIVGAGANQTIIHAGGNVGLGIPALEDRVFHVLSGATLNLEGVTVTGGTATASGTGNQVGGGINVIGGTLNLTAVEIVSNTATNFGGGIHAASSSAITISDSTIASNSVITASSTNGNGGGLYNTTSSTYVISNSTISGNLANNLGGGIHNTSSGGTISITHSTITGNRANANDSDPPPTTGGGGIRRVGGGAITLHNTIVAGNFLGSGTTPNDLSGSFSGTFNLIGDAGTAGGLSHGGTNGNIVGDGSTGTLVTSTILNTTLANNGGPTRTHALVTGSLAIDAGNPAFTPPPNFDQRGTGFPRVSGGRLDIGAFELAPAFAITTTSLPNGTYGTAYSQTIETVNGSPPLSFSISAGALPNGLTLAAATGQISGTPTAAGSFTFTVSVTDSASSNTSRQFTIIINPRPLTVSATAQNKVYDGNANASVTLSDDRLSGDVLTVHFTSATFNNKNVGTNKTVTVSGISITGADAANYTVSPTATTTANITARTLNVTAQAQNKVYDGTVNATITFNDDRIAGDVLTVTFTSATFNNKNVGTNKPVTISGVNLSGADAGNYTLTSPPTSSQADITVRTLTVSATAENKVYDGNANATVNLSDNRVAGDVLTISFTSATFNNKNVGTNKTVTVSGISITGTDAGNYTLGSTTATTTANITARTLTVSATAQNKVYDGNANATVTLSDNRVSGDVLTVHFTSATFNNKNVGTNKTVTVSGISITGADAANYTVSPTATTTANITARTLNVTAQAQNKVYDGTVNATINFSDDRIAGDVLTVTFTSATFNNKNVGTNKTVTVSGLALSGADAGNYTLASSPVTTQADITPASLTVRADNKFKGFGMPNPELTFTITGFVTGEDLASSGVNGEPVLSTSATQFSPPGQYAIQIEVGTLTAANYVFDFQDGVLSIVTVGIYAIGADTGGGPLVRVFDSQNRTLLFSFFAYSPSFTGGVRVAVGDVNGDGIPDIITAPGPGGGPHIKVFSGVDLTVLASFMAFNANFTGGVFVAAGNLDGDNTMEVIVGAGAGGGPHVRSFKIDNGTATLLPGPLGNFFAYAPNFTGGVHVAAGNFDGVGADEIITAPGAGGGPHVKVFRADGVVVASFFAYAPSFAGGVWIAAGDLDGNGSAEIITGAGAGGGPHVKVFNGGDATVLKGFFAYDHNFTGGVRVGMVTREGGGGNILTGTGPGGGPHTRVFDGVTLDVLDNFFALDPLFTGGMFVGGR
ncbi:MAG: beta strand repeat-containing protein [Gemmataceae bacterium]